ncbi:hypothetical protein [Paludisphaera mucosa]|uniref:Uncharacterized protein n=1 Tax=Paludisphaera mucosa TaxID=3030827 RepID=A0ABT6F3W1_9BACT|nr:hypothetical protein [Paludisphaera mucosa]MDG3002236.1 hypothetical protein [Paludisphaera mucosa]
MRILMNLDSQLSGTEDRGAFYRVGHSPLVALAAGLLGGTVAAWFYTKRGPAAGEPS